MPNPNLREALRNQCVSCSVEVQRAVRQLTAATYALENLEWKGDAGLYVEERAALRAAVERAELHLDETWERVAAEYDAALDARGSGASV